MVSRLGKVREKIDDKRDTESRLLVFKLKLSRVGFEPTKKWKVNLDGDRARLLSEVSGVKLD